MSHQTFDWDALGIDIEAIIYWFLDLKSMDILSSCNKRFHEQYLKINIYRIISSKCIFKYIESAHHSKYEFNIKPCSVKNVCNLYCMFKSFKLSIIKHSWFRISSYKYIRKSVNRFDRYNVSLNKFIQAVHDELMHAQHIKNNNKYITMTYNEHIRISIQQKCYPK